MNPKDTKKIIIAIAIVAIAIFASVAYYENYRSQHSDYNIPVLISPFINNSSSPHEVCIRVSAKIDSKNFLTYFDFSDFWLYIYNGTTISALRSALNSSYSDIYENVSFNISSSHPVDILHLNVVSNPGYYHMIPSALGGSTKGGFALMKFTSNTTFRVTANGDISFINIPGVSSP
ncbi:MAG: hypothetical protein LVQ96_05395 [Thermoplasmatales archaeon]|nr:hypothetical protein [Thermoplasmatales archaeon]MCW6170587.1 hypothetical protein [Thermoplasmatales archaeon]